jgi:hypothetical protein
MIDQHQHLGFSDDVVFQPVLAAGLFASGELASPWDFSASSSEMQPWYKWRKQVINNVDAPF